jgi:hypothetical protein
MSKQTAVNFLRGEAIKLVVQAMQGTLNENTLEHQISEIVTQALQMEREQIIDAYYEGKEYGFKEHGEQYYNETYGGQDE